MWFSTLIKSNNRAFLKLHLKLKLKKSLFSVLLTTNVAFPVGCQLFHCYFECGLCFENQTDLWLADRKGKKVHPPKWMPFEFFLLAYINTCFSEIRLVWELAGKRGGGGVCALRPFAYQQGADTVPVVLDRWGVCVRVCLHVCVNPQDRCLGMGYFREQVHPRPPPTHPPSYPPSCFLPCSTSSPGGLWGEWLERPWAP